MPSSSISATAARASGTSLDFPTSTQIACPQLHLTTSLHLCVLILRHRVFLLGGIYKERCIVGLKSWGELRLQERSEEGQRSTVGLNEVPVAYTVYPKIPSRQFSILTLQPPPCLSGGRGKTISHQCLCSMALSQNLFSSIISQVRAKPSGLL